MLRMTHEKLVQSHNMLMAIFTNSATKRQYEDDQLYSASRNMTIDDSNSKPRSYLQSEYPLVKYWTRQQWKENENTSKDASDLLESKDKPRGGTRSARGENVMMLYIEHVDGMPIDGAMAAQIREHARMVWKDFYQRGKAPEKWTDASRDVREEYLREMEGRWEVLRYCDNHWKANKVATSLYSIWYNQYHRKATKNQNDHTHEDRPLNKKARISRADSEDRIRGSLEPENQTNGGAVSEISVEDIEGADRELHSPFHLQTESATSQASSRPKPRPLKDPL